MSVHMLDHSNSQGPHESDVNKNILLTLQKYSKYLYFSKLICQQLICQQLFLRGAQKLFKVRSWHFLIFSTAINQNKEIELDHVDSGLKINRYVLKHLMWQKNESQSLQGRKTVKFRTFLVKMEAGCCSYGVWVPPRQGKANSSMYLHKIGAKDRVQNLKI